MSAEQIPTRRTCGQMIVHELLVETQPDYRANRLEAERRTRRSIEDGEASRVAAQLITLPVVVHIVYRTEDENIADGQVKRQIEALNRDFRAKNADLRNVPPVWKSLATDGITRTKTVVESFRPDDGVKSSETGGVEPWPTDRYLNLWACTLGRSLL